MSDQPTPGDVLKQLKDGSTVAMGGGAPAAGGVPRGTTVMRSVSTVAQAQAMPLTAEPLEGAAVALHSFQDVVALFAAKKQALIQSQLVNYVHLVKFEQGHMALRLKEGAPQKLVGDLTEKLNSWTGQRWIVSLSREQGEPTLAELRQNEAQSVMTEVAASPVVAETLKVFPGAKVIDIRERK